MNIKKYFICLLFIPVFTAVLFAQEKRESPTRHNVYFNWGQSFYGYEKWTLTFMSMGYEGAIGRFFSLGANFSVQFGPSAMVFDCLSIPRFYFGRSSLEKFFIGANLGIGANLLEDPEDQSIFTIGLNGGYKFVFGSRSFGFSLEPSIGYDFLPGRLNINLATGFAWGGKARSPAGSYTLNYAQPSFGDPLEAHGVYVIDSFNIYGNFKDRVRLISRSKNTNISFRVYIHNSETHIWQEYGEGMLLAFNDTDFINSPLAGRLNKYRYFAIEAMDGNEYRYTIAKRHNDLYIYINDIYTP